MNHFHMAASRLVLAEALYSAPQDCLQAHLLVHTQAYPMEHLSRLSTSAQRLWVPQELDHHLLLFHRLPMKAEAELPLDQVVLPSSPLHPMRVGVALLLLLLQSCPRSTFQTAPPLPKKLSQPSILLLPPSRLWSLPSICHLRALIRPRM